MLHVPAWPALHALNILLTPQTVSLHTIHVPDDGELFYLVLIRLNYLVLRTLLDSIQESLAKCMAFM